MGLVKLDLGQFINMAVIALDANHKCLMFGETFIPVLIDGDYKLFRPASMDWLMNIIRGVFYKCFGGWQIYMRFDDAGIYTGNASFVPAASLGSSAPCG